jgi:hypothetical protein
MAEQEALFVLEKIAADTQLPGGERLHRRHLTFEVYVLGIKVLSKQTVVELTGEQPE